MITVALRKIRSVRRRHSADMGKGYGMYYKSIVSVDRANRCYQVVVLFDDNDPNAVICQHTFGGMPATYDPDRVYVTDEEIDRELIRMGFQIVGKDAPALAWGERIVCRANSDHVWFDPRTQDWCTLDPSKLSE